MNDVNKNPCVDRREAIEALASGVDIDPGIREHLLVCPGCNAYYRTQRRLEELIGETTGALDDPRLRSGPRRRKVSVKRVAAASSALALMLAAAVSLAVVLSNGRTSEQGPTVQPSVVATSEHPEEPAAEIVRQAPRPTVIESTTLVTKGDEQLVKSFEGGMRLSLSGEGRAVVEKIAGRSFNVRLSDGLLVADVPETTPRTRLTVEADNIRVAVRGTLFAVRARDRLITDVRVERGEVDVASKVSNEHRIVRSGEALSVETLTVRTVARDMPTLHAAFLVEVPIEEELEIPAAPKPTAKKGATDYEMAEALRAEGKYEEAVVAFLAASKSSKGLERERSLYQAASLSLTKLGDTQQSIMHSKSYVSQYPNGIYTEGAIILQARAHMRAKDYEKARAALKGYIDAYPQGTQTELAHLLLGKIFATTYGNCKAAIPHLEFVTADGGSGARAKQAQMILDWCKNK
jgi:hypothetical protein